MIISWNVTKQCNLQCKHCYRDAGARDSDELTTEEGKALLSEIAGAGFKIIVLSGGEPLMREDILDLISHASGVGLRPVLGSNGELITPDMARRLKAAGAMRIGISLDSTDPRKHDEFRASPGSFERAIRGMRSCREAGLQFQMHTTVMDWNADEAEALIDLALELGASAHHFFFLVPTGRAKNIAEESLREAEYERLLRRILRKQREVSIELKPTCAPHFMRIADQMGMKMRYAKGCLAGISYCVVIPNGDVHPCPYLPIKVGNVRETPFGEIWRGNGIFDTLRSEEYGGKCGQCKYSKTCGGCRARAYYYSGGDYMAEEPWCLYKKYVQPAGEAI
ncbi:MAG: putative heme d1 biosynthesis radical SAM protein NirJ2 [bacterium]